MSKFKSQDLLNDLQEDVRRIIDAAEHLKIEHSVKLAYQVSPDRWSIVQILEHLNAYNRYYIPAIENAIAEKKDKGSAWFQSGYWGNKFTKMMKPTNVYQIKQKMKAMKSYRFPNSLNVDIVFNEFIQHNKKLVELLETAKERDLNNIRIPITLSKFIKLKLGDTFRFLIAHEQRHMVQARNTLHDLGVTTDKFPVILEAAAL